VRARSRAKARLTYGQYEKAPGREAQEKARFQFLATVERHAPEVLKALSDEPFDIYVEMFG